MKMLNKDAFNYIDPGTGAAIVGSILPLIAAIFSAILAFLIKYFWEPIKRFFSKLKNPGKKDNK
jgi:hypothetical protein